VRTIATYPVQIPVDGMAVDGDLQLGGGWSGRT
jgi:hypothetical protein